MKIAKNYASHMQVQKDDDNFASSNNRVKFKLIKRDSKMINESTDKSNMNQGTVLIYDF